MEKFSEDNIKEVNINFNPGVEFMNLRPKAEFRLVASRIAQAAVLKAEKAKETTVDLEAAKKKPTSNKEEGSGDNKPSGSGDNKPTGNGDGNQTGGNTQTGDNTQTGGSENAGGTGSEDGTGDDVKL